MPLRVGECLAEVSRCERRAVLHRLLEVALVLLHERLLEAAVHAVGGLLLRVVADAVPSERALRGMCLTGETARPATLGGCIVQQPRLRKAPGCAHHFVVRTPSENTGPSQSGDQPSPALTITANSAEWNRLSRVRSLLLKPSTPSNRSAKVSSNSWLLR
jgi:hypothetical protein